jgi:hypothetical protein
MTDIAGDTGHTVQLVMQPFGAIISGTQPPTAWTFGTVGEGSIGTFQGTMIQNGGNAPATVTLQPLSLPSVFGLQGNPVTVAPNGTTALVGQFTPNLANGTWTGQAELVVTASALCAPLPAAWMSPQITMSGASSSSPVVTIAGNLVFPTTDCGGSAAAGQSVTLTNSTNQVYTYTLKFVSGTHYTFADGGSGNLPADGTATIVVNPKAVTPGPGVLAGSAPYADDLIVTLATSPATTLTMPISWTLNGAVLSLPQGAGPFVASGSSVYVADSTSGFPLSIANTGTAAATVNFGILPSGAFSLLPAPPVDVLPGIPALPELVSGPSAPACPALASGSATFTYVGPVCQPLPVSSVTVDSCSGTSSAQGCFLPTGDINCPTQTNTCVPTPNSTTSNCGTCANACTGTTPLCTASGSAPGGYQCTAAPPAAPPTPCTTAGQTNCVQCPGSTGGVCDATEALFVNIDITNLVVTSNTPDMAANGCYQCMLAGSCIDSPSEHQSDLECEDLNGTFTDFSGAMAAASTLCDNALGCMVGTAGDSCALNAEGEAFCYCGSAPGTSIAQCQSGGSLVNGPCLSSLVPGYKYAQSDATDILPRLTDDTEPSGKAMGILSCGATNGCTQCLHP